MFKGYLSYIAGAALLIAGVGKLLIVFSQCLTGDLSVDACMVALTVSYDAVVAAATGLGIVGVRRAIANQ